MDAQEQIIYSNTIDYFAQELAARNMTVDNENPELLFELKVVESKEQRQHLKADLYDAAAMKRELHPAVHALLENYPVKAIFK